MRTFPEATTSNSSFAEASSASHRSMQWQSNGRARNNGPFCDSKTGAYRGSLPDVIQGDGKQHGADLPAIALANDLPGLHPVVGLLAILDDSIVEPDRTHGTVRFDADVSKVSSSAAGVDPRNFAN